MDMALICISFHAKKIIHETEADYILSKAITTIRTSNNKRGGGLSSSI